MSKSPHSKVILPILAGIILLPALWTLAKTLFGIPDRYLPGLDAVLSELAGRSNFYAYHASISFSRVVFGYVVSILVAIFASIMMFRSEFVQKTLETSIQSLRSVPATATVPFFILWFGFQEIGKIVLIVFGISLSLIISSLQVLNNIPERYLIALRGFGVCERRAPINVLAPLIVTNIAPTLRFSLSVATSLVVVAEYLGAQTGLGYVMQGARTTYAMDSLVVCAVLFGAIAAVLDSITILVWNFLTPWRDR